MYKLSSKVLSCLLVVTLVLSSFPMGEGVKAEESMKKNPDWILNSENDEYQKNTENEKSRESTEKEKLQESNELIAPNSDEDYLPVEDIAPEEHMTVKEGNEPGVYKLEAYDDAVKIINSTGEVVPVDSNLELTQEGFSPKATALPVSFDQTLR